MSTMSPVFQQSDWRWYSDATPDGSMVALAAERTAPTLTAAQMQNGIIRLRVVIYESAGVAGTTGALTLQYSVDGTNWRNIEAQSPTTRGAWFRHANGAAVNGNTIGTRLITAGLQSGKYHEDGTATETLIALGQQEVDFAIYVHWPAPDTTISFRVTSGGTALPLSAGEPTIQLITAAAANRPNTITVYDDDPASASDPGTFNYSLYRRVHYDGVGRWWVFYVDYDLSNTVKYASWGGTGAWSAVSSIQLPSAGSMRDARNRSWVQNIGGTPVVFVAGFPSGSGYYSRGTISGSSISWGAETATGTSGYNYGALCCDDGGYWWLAGIKTASAQIAIRRSTNADTGSSWTAGFNAEQLLSDTGASSSSVISMVPIGSNKVLVMWYNTTAQCYKAATYSEGVGWGAITNVVTVGGVDTACDNNDAGLVRSGNYVYVAHTNQAADGGALRLKVYNISGDSWSAGPSPNIGASAGSGDGAPVTYDSGADKLYLFIMHQGPEGGDDRYIRYETYSGPGASGTWDNNVTVLSPGNRGNMDVMTSTRDASGGNIVVLAEFGDDGLIGSPYAAEYHYLDVTSGTNANVNLSTQSQSQSQGALTTSGTASLALSVLSETPSISAVQAGVAASFSLSTQSETQTISSITTSGTASQLLVLQSQTQSQGVISASGTSSFALSPQSEAALINSLTASADAEYALAAQSQEQSLNALTETATGNYALVLQSEVAAQGAVTAGAGSSAEFTLTTASESAVQGAVGASGDASQALSLQSQPQDQGSLSFSGTVVYDLSSILEVAQQPALSWSGDSSWSLTTQSQAQSQQSVSLSATSDYALSTLPETASQGAVSASGGGSATYPLTLQTQTQLQGSLSASGSSTFALSSVSQSQSILAVTSTGGAGVTLVVQRESAAQGAVTASGGGSGTYNLSVQNQAQVVGGIGLSGTASTTLSSVSQPQTINSVGVTVGQDVTLATQSEPALIGPLDVTGTALYAIQGQAITPSLFHVTAASASDAEATWGSLEQPQSQGVLGYAGSASWLLSSLQETALQGTLLYSADALLDLATLSQNAVAYHVSPVIGRLRPPPLWIVSRSGSLPEESSTRTGSLLSGLSSTRTGSLG